MKLIHLALSLVVSAAVLAGAVPTPAEERDVMAAMHAWIQAVNRQDIPALRTILHDELIFSHSDARTQNKEEVLADVQAGRGAAGVELSGTIVRVYGITALVKATVHVKGRPRPDGSAPPSTGRPPNIISVMHVLVKGESGWQLVSRQATRPPAPQSPAH